MHCDDVFTVNPRIYVYGQFNTKFVHISEENVDF